MKRLTIIMVAIALLTLPGAPRAAENAEPVKRGTPQAATPPAANEQPTRPPARRFSLDFTGGNPHAFIEAVSKALGKPVNVIITDDQHDVVIPALKMADVSLPELFAALSASSQRRVRYVTGYSSDGRSVIPQYNQAHTSFGFRTSASPPTEDSIYYFYQEPAPQDVALSDERSSRPSCRFWNVGPYLDSFKVEDITTAVETGWKMQGTTPAPKLSFHKDTKLLIGVGDSRQLEMVDEVLMQLQPPRAATGARDATRTQ